MSCKNDDHDDHDDDDDGNDKGYDDGGDDDDDDDDDDYIETPNCGFFSLQSPNCAADCLQRARSRDLSSVVFNIGHFSHATHATWLKRTAQVLKLHLFFSSGRNNKTDEGGAETRLPEEQHRRPHPTPAAPPPPPSPLFPHAHLNNEFQRKHILKPD